MNKTQLASISSSDLIEAKLEEEHRSGYADCPSCGRKLEGKPEWLGLPAGVKFDPTDQELIEHLEAKVVVEAPPHEGSMRSHPLIDEFIPTIDGEDGICYTHPENLPGVTKDGLSRHFFHRPSRAYTTGTRKRRKIQTENDDVQTGGETRWHKTGKTRPVMINGNQKGCKKILVLYTNFGKNRKPEKTNWVMHQYHLGQHEEEKDGELVVSKIFYQTQPRQSSWSSDRSSATIGERNIINNIISMHHQIPNNNNINSEYSNRRDSNSGGFASKEVINQRRGDDDQLSGPYGNMDMQQINSDRFGFAPFGKGFNELQQEMGKAASGSGKTAAEHGIAEHLQIQSQHDAQRQQHHPQLTNISMPVSSAIMPPDPLHHTSIILNEDPYHLSELMLQNQTFQHPHQEHHKLVGSTSTLEDLIMGCTSTDKKAESSSSSSMATSQDAEWFKYSSFWSDPDNPNQHG